MKRALPSLVTLIGAGAALVAMVLAPHHPYAACNAIIVAALADMVDGRVARMLDAQSEFGAQLDSLVDVISFGVAPALLAYHVQLDSLGSLGLVPLGLAPAFAFVAAAAIRLARFNSEDSSAADPFRGIPSPVAALLVTTPIMAMLELGLDWVARPEIGAGWMLTCALLMVAPLPFPSFKHFRSRVLQLAYFGAMAGGVLLLLFGLPGGAVLFGFLLLYLFRGLASSLLGGRGP